MDWNKNMDWNKKIAEGMRLIAEGCEANGEWNACDKCIFDDYCDAIVHGFDAKFYAMADFFRETLEEQKVEGGEYDF